jgi:plastocyanin
MSGQAGSPMLDSEVSDDMRRLPALSLTFLAVLALAGCSASAAPGWTYAPVPSASAGASGAPSGGPSGAPSAAAPSVAPSVAGSVAPSASAGESASASGGAATLTVTALIGAASSGFQPTTLEAAANTAFTLTFDNQDTQAQHNLVVQKADGSLVQVSGDTAPFQGPDKRVYQVPALAAGAYPYICQVHPGTMKGTLTVK